MPAGRFGPAPISALRLLCSSAQGGQRWCPASTFSQPAQADSRWARLLEKGSSTVGSIFWGAPHLLQTRAALRIWVTTPLLKRENRPEAALAASWHAREGSNPGLRFWRPPCYRCTTGVCYNPSHERLAALDRDAGRYLIFFTRPFFVIKRPLVTQCFRISSRNLVSIDSSSKPIPVELNTMFA